MRGKSNDACPVNDAVIVPAAKLPDPSRLTIVLTVLASVAAFAAFAPLATLAAETVPTVETTVALCVPVTSPDNDPLNVEPPVVHESVAGFAPLVLNTLPLVPTPVGRFKV